MKTYWIYNENWKQDLLTGKSSVLTITPNNGDGQSTSLSVSEFKGLFYIPEVDEMDFFASLNK